MALSQMPATNCWTLAERNVANILLACPTLLIYLGVLTPNEASAGNMWYDSIGSAPEEYTDEQWEALFPQVIIGTPGDNAAALEISEPSTSHSQNQGSIELQFASMVKVNDYESSWHKPWIDDFWPANTFSNANPPTESDYEQSFKNAIGNILVEAQEQILIHPNLWQVSSYGRQSLDEAQSLGDLQTADVMVPWGSDGGGEA